ncbi:MAG: sigma-70 family RNA polymerase sigma factor [Aldersonia sp.]|nr:sigma-70 family RNA polymerase sigma factor [Aldersonia sp.]
MWMESDDSSDGGEESPSAVSGRASGRDVPAADAELYELVSTAGFTGQAWELLADKLARHGLVVVDAWLGSGRIFAEAVRKGMPLTPTAAESAAVGAPPLLHELANATVAEAIVAFRRAGMAGSGWHPDAGASLHTYFVTGCVHAFVKEFRRWQRAGGASGPALVGDVDGFVERNGRHRGEDDVATRVADLDVVRRHLGALEERDRYIVYGKAIGYTNAEIATLFGESSAKAVERRWSRLMERVDWIRRLSFKESR